MDTLLFTTFVITSLALIVIPGPNVLVIVSTSITHGAKRGLQTVFGTSSAMVIQLIIAATGTSWLVSSLTDGLTWLRWLGVAYLIYLGVIQLSRMTISKRTERPSVTGKGSFGRGFVVSLTNPKTILFFGAFLPQFVSANSGYLNQVIVLSITFLVLATLLDSLYALMAGRLGALLQGPQIEKIQQGVSGLLYLGAGALLATMRRS